MSDQETTQKIRCEECGATLVSGYGEQFCQNCYVSDGFHALAAVLQQEPVEVPEMQEQEMSHPTSSPQEVTSPSYS